MTWLKTAERGRQLTYPDDNKDVYGDYAHPIQLCRAEELALEHRISDLVNQACGLTPEEIDLMWKTAPPRMPFNRP